MELSIITVNLNNAEGLDQTIESVKIQSFRNFEHIIIDGGSDDGSLDIISHYEKSVSYWISEKDTGIYHAMNKGITQANGDYCFFLNSGDFFAGKDVLKDVFRNRPTEGLVYGNLIVCNQGKKKVRVKGKDNLTFLDVYSNLVKHQSSFIRRELFNSFGFYNEDLKIAADWEFFLKTIGFGRVSSHYIDLDIAYFDNDGYSNNNPLLAGKERAGIIKEYLPEMMHHDYEFMFRYGRYFDVVRFSSAFLFLRVLTKLASLWDRIFKSRNT